LKDSTPDSNRLSKLGELEGLLTGLYRGLGCGETLALRLSSSPVSDTTAFAAEDMLSASVTPGRREEFRTGRALARKCMAAIGVAPQSIARGEMREPIWPAGLTGSISHAKGLIGAVVWQPSTAGGIGLDIERAGRVTPTLYQSLFTDAEVESLSLLNSVEQLVAAAAMFSAKEAIYKAQYPLTRCYVGFHEVSLGFDPVSKQVRLQHVPDILKPIAISVFVHSGETYVITGAVAITCQPSPK
jgi:4'-phosphopantetheinyl transferase EntD